MKIKKAKVEEVPKEDLIPPASETSTEPAPDSVPTLSEEPTETVEAPPPVEAGPVVSEIVVEIVSDKPVVEAKEPEAPAGPDPLEFVKCRAKKTVLARGMPYFEGDIFMHYRGAAEEAVARGDLELI